MTCISWHIYQFALSMLGNSIILDSISWSGHFTNVNTALDWPRNDLWTFVDSEKNCLTSISLLTEFFISLNIIYVWKSRLHCSNSRLQMNLYMTDEWAKNSNLWLFIYIGIRNKRNVRFHFLLLFHQHQQSTFERHPISFCCVILTYEFWLKYFEYCRHLSTLLVNY